MKANRRILQNLAAAAAALALWQAAAMLLGQKILLASPLEVAERLSVIWREPGFFSSIAFSLLRIVGGFFAALLLGTALAALASRFSLAETLLRPYMLTIKSVPVASFIVIALIWLSSANLSVFISFLMVLPIIYTNLLSGLKSSDRLLDQAAAVFRMSARRRLLYIRLPQIRPYLTSACTVALGLAWKAGIAAEVIGIPDGSIGERLYEAKVYLATADLFAWTAVIVLCSLIFEKLFLLLLGLFFKGAQRL